VKPTEAVFSWQVAYPFRNRISLTHFIAFGTARFGSAPPVRVTWTRSVVRLQPIHILGPKSVVKLPLASGQDPILYGRLVAFSVSLPSNARLPLSLQTGPLIIGR
jgi:hypothetical protein